MTKTFHGSCHCGAVRFECDLDLANGTSKCNCSVCRKGRFWKAIVMANAFRLRQGTDALSEYQFGGHVIHHLFCRHCGIKPFGHANVAELGGEFYAVNLACLDASDEELASAPVRYEDGRNNDWQSAPAETRYL
jgi:hypothetical protein